MIVKAQTYTFGHTSDDALPLRCGRKLGPVSIAYETWGTLNPEPTQPANMKNPTRSRAGGTI
jgi:homoserine acetyltransferase